MMIFEEANRDPPGPTWDPPRFREASNGHMHAFSRGTSGRRTKIFQVYRMYCIITEYSSSNKITIDIRYEEISLDRSEMVGGFVNPTTKHTQKWEARVESNIL